MKLSQRDAAIAFPSIFVLLAVAFGLISQYGILESLRPGAAGGLEDRTRRIPARLWQDPLEAVKSALDQGQLPPLLRAEDVRETIGERLDAGTGVQVLAVTLQGTDYSESRETRLRSRYAVLTGLSAMGYFPTNGESIQALETTFQVEEPSPQVLPLKVPLEWFTRVRAEAADPPDAREDDQKPSDTLVLWLDEDRLGQRLLKEAHRLFLAFTPEDADRLAFDIIGPTNSTALQRSARAAREASAEQDDPPAAAIEASFYSPWSTAELPGMTSGAELELGFTFVPMIGTDAQLCRLVARELEMRGVKGPGNAVVMVSEWDTVYGRQLPIKLEEELRAVYGDQPPLLRHLTYLRGIDGLRPGKKKSAGDDASSQEKPGDLLTRASGGQGVKWPEGESQYDYLRRLRNSIEEFSWGRRIAAIGVTGSDVHDKLLVLKALREDFPTTLFFTTDLDVRLLHPSQRRWTHSLLVASHYALAPGTDFALGARSTEEQLEKQLVDEAARWLLETSDLPMTFPQFRYSYQSAIMLSVMAAFQAPQIERRDLIANPRIYEVGRTRPLLLNEESRRPLYWFKWLAVPFLLVSLPLPLLLPIGRMPKPPACLPSASPADIVKRGARLLLFTLAHSIPFLVLYMLYLRDRSSVSGEPRVWDQGVSLWPTLFLLLLLVMLSAYFFKRIWFGFQRYLDRIQERCFPSSGKENTDRNGPKNILKAPEVWDSFRQLVEPQRLGRRMALCSLVLLPATTLIVKFLPRRPFRGELTYALDLVLVFLGLLAMAYVITLMLDITYFSYHLIRCIGRERTDWPVQEETGSKPSKVLVDIGREWKDIDLISQLTEFHNRFIYLPFILLLVYGLAHHYLFDNWVYRPLELIEYLAGIALAWLPLIAVHLAATAARRDSLARLRRRHVQAWSRPDETRHIEDAIKDIEAIRIGAFAPLSQNPILGTVLLPFGGIGGLMLLEALLV